MNVVEIPKNSSNQFSIYNQGQAKVHTETKSMNQRNKLQSSSGSVHNIER